LTGEVGQSTSMGSIGVSDQTIISDGLSANFMK
jgi:hypothetical protein